VQIRKNKSQNAQVMITKRAGVATAVVNVTAKRLKMNNAADANESTKLTQRRQAAKIFVIFSIFFAPLRLGVFALMNFLPNF
jgi:hypothetical protein